MSTVEIWNKFNGLQGSNAKECIDNWYSVHDIIVDPYMNVLFFIFLIFISLNIFV